MLMSGVGIGTEILQQILRMKALMLLCPIPKKSSAAGVLAMAIIVALFPVGTMILRKNAAII